MKEQSENPANQLHESPKNLMRSWHSLRHLDQDLAETKYSDLADDSNKSNKEQKRA